VHGDLIAAIALYQDTRCERIAEIAQLTDESVPLWCARRNQGRSHRRLCRPLFDASGNFITGKRSDLDFNLQEATFIRFVQLRAFRGALSLAAPGGSYTVRTVLEDGMEGKLAAQSRKIQIP
jgi:hypothetical protein